MMSDPHATDPDEPWRRARRREAALEEAALWLARLDSGSADQGEFERWRSASPENAIAFARVAGAWTAWDEAVAVPTAAPRPRLSRRAVMAFGAAALAAPAIALSGRALARDRAATGVGERRTVALGPDLRAELNTDSRIAWRLNGETARLWLEKGEAGIAVSAASALISAAGATISLAPGAYNVRLRGERLECSVLRGAAQATSGVRVAEGQKLVGSGADLSAAVISAKEAAEIAAWPDGELVFEDATLKEALAEYNRYLSRKLVILDPAVGELRIGGRFTSTDPTDFLQGLETAFAIRAKVEEDRIVLRQSE